MSSTGRTKLSREAQRDLDIEISFLEGVARRDPQYVDALRILGDDYTRRGRFEEGLKIDEQLAQMQPGDPMVQYNLACSYVLTGQFEEAYLRLNLAIDQGYRDFRWMSRDPDLLQFRKHRLYRKLRARIRALQVKVR